MEGVRKESNELLSTLYHGRTVKWKWKLTLHTLFLVLCLILQVIGTLCGATFLNSATHKDAIAIVLVLLAVGASFTAVYFQWHDAYVPSLRAKFHHALWSLVTTALNAAVVAYAFDKP